MIKLVSALVTNDFYKDRKYILSTREDSITIPFWEVDDYKNLKNEFQAVIVRECFKDVTMAAGYVSPQFISINDEYISKLFEDSSDCLYFLYGAIVPQLDLKDNFYWKSFDILDPNILTELGVIHNVISHTI